MYTGRGGWVIGVGQRSDDLGRQCAHWSIGRETDLIYKIMLLPHLFEVLGGNLLLRLPAAAVH